jgi:hydroxymethylbilane synthase
VSPLRIGTRGSPLALWQARAVAEALRIHAVETEIVTLSTGGDRRAEAPVSQLGKGVFVKDIEDALLQGAVDIAVHSAKDMAASAPEGLATAAVLPRDDPRDALVLPLGARTDRNLWQSALSVGTSSPRRLAQLKTLLPHARFEDVRGNVDTRLRKLDAGTYDALVLAAAGLRRLGLGHRISEAIAPDKCVPAPGQAIVAVQVRADDERTYALVSAINDQDSRLALDVEQTVVRTLGGGCQLPLGVLAEVNGTRLSVRAAVAAADGSERIESVASGETRDAARIALNVAADLRTRGAMRILES